MTAMRLDGKVAIVTGASEGIGAALVHALRARGAKLAITARSAEKLALVAGSDGLAIPGDLTEEATRQAVIDGTIERFGRIDILINNAGVGLYAPSHATPVSEARRLWELNFFTPLDMIQRATVHMKRQRSGSIVNVGSIAGKVTLPWFTLYSASKYAIGSMTDGLRMELRSFGIHTMTVCPGYVNTRFQSNVIIGAPPPLAGAARRWAISPEKCAKDIVRGIESGKRTVVTPASGWALIVLERLFPTLVDRQLEKVYLQRERQS
ncbi:MAG TPA: SDR family NAD(P)-dependent oxidoreductase [Bryobacteraceae bacterium]|nr:SDR family NAD(P)-dependent oxidoreductase [Bryobacteraceae bacterium]